MIDLECIGHENDYELSNIIHLFKPYVKTAIGIKSSLESTKVTTLLQTEDKTLENTQIRTQQQDPIRDKRYAKQLLKKSLYELLSGYTGITMPWGILTGIRPTKIVHDLQSQGLTQEEIKEELKQTYHIQEDKIKLMIDVAIEESKILATNKPNEINIYIGIPFCPTRCVYCSFTAYDIKAKKNNVAPYLDALCKEISFIAEAKKDVPIKSLYIGGGTPTSLDEAQLETLLKHIQHVFPLEKIEEYTVEAGRPDTITEEKLKLMKKYGVGRISINPQTMNQKTLDAIGRHHTVEAINEVFHKARACGHTNINMDMILGLPGEEVEDVAYTLKELQKLNPENITVHTMAIKRASRLKEAQKDYELTEGKKIQKMLELCKVRTEEMGLKPYYMYRQKNMLGNFENVGYAKPGYECIYNIEIMEEKQSIIAAGAGAITKMVFDDGQRIERVPNVKSLEDYITRIDEMIERKRNYM